MDGGPRTRSRAKTQVEQWESVPLPLKLMLLLADAMVEAQAQGTCGAGSDSGDSDEWVDESEERYDEHPVRAEASSSVHHCLTHNHRCTCTHARTHTPHIW